MVEKNVYLRIDNRLEFSDLVTGMGSGNGKEGAEIMECFDSRNNSD